MFPPELFIEVYKHIRYPISLILTNKEFHHLCVDPVAKSIWALANFGRIHVLFYAISLGKTFITVDVVKTLLAPVLPKSLSTRIACALSASIERSRGVFLSSASPVQLKNAVGITSVEPLGFSIM